MAAQTTTVTPDRKQLEREFHDQWREQGDGGAQPANTRFYSIGRTSHAFTTGWLQDRCRGKRVLDYCCGFGHTAMFAAEHGAAEARGVDISPVSVEHATRTATARGLSSRVRFDVMDAEATTYPDGYFDAIVVSGVLHHLDLDRAYRELARILTADGEILCTEALRHNPIFHWYRKLTPNLRTAWEVDHILGRSQIRLAQRYFRGVRIERFFYLTALAAVPLRKTPLFLPLLTLLEKIDALLLRVPLVCWLAWIAVFTLAAPKPRIES